MEYAAKAMRALRISITSITVLAQEAFFGVEIALNDGHLFHYEEGRQALTTALQRHWGLTVVRVQPWGAGESCDMPVLVKRIRAAARDKAELARCGGQAILPVLAS